MAPRPGSKNGLINGAQISIVRLKQGLLPPEMQGLKKNLINYRRTLERAVVETHGGINLTQAHWVDSAVAHQTHASICQWLMRKRGKTMANKDLILASKTIADAKERRNRCMMQLEIEKTERDRLREELDHMYQDGILIGHASQSKEQSDEKD